MTRNFVTFTQTFSTTDTTSTTLPNSYINMKRGIMELVKADILASGLGFTFRAENTPLATTAAQTIHMDFDTPLVCNETGNWILRASLTFGALNANNNVTLSFNVVRSSQASYSLMVSTGWALTSAWAANPTSITVDFKSILAQSQSSISIGVIRANSILTNPVSVFPSSGATFFKYKVIETGDVRWALISNSLTDQPLRILNSPSATEGTSIGFPLHPNFGFVPTQTSEWNCLELPVVYFNQTNASTSPLRFMFERDDDPDLLFVTAPASGTATAITQGSVVSLVGSDDNFYVVCVFMGKMALVKITG